MPLEQGLQVARTALMRAQKDTQDAFMRYTSCLDIERQARQAVAAAEKRRDDISMSGLNTLTLKSNCMHSGSDALAESTDDRHVSSSTLSLYNF